MQYIGQGTARALIGQATTTVTQTVGTIENTCPTTDSIAVENGTTVYYCLTITKTGTFDFVRHEVTAPQLGASFVYTPANPAVAQQQITAQQVRDNYPPNRLEKTISAPFTNKITVTSYTAEGIVTENSATAYVAPGQASAALTYTVGTDPARCATTTTLTVATNATAYYCIELENTGTLPLERFEINAPQLGLARTYTATLAPSATLVLTQSFDSKLAKTIVTNETNAITIDAYTADGISVRNQKSVATNVGTLGLTVIKYAHTDAKDCSIVQSLTVDSGREFFYCVVIRNTGVVPLVNFTVSEASPVINFSFNYDLGVGQTLTLTNEFLANTLKQSASLGPFTTAFNLNSTMSVVARSASGAVFQANSAFPINVVVPTATPIRTATPTLTWTPTLTPIPTTTPTVPPTPTPTNVVVSILPSPTDPFNLNSVQTPTPGVVDDAGAGFVPESPLTDSFFGNADADGRFLCHRVCPNRYGDGRPAMTQEAELTQTAFFLTEQAPPLAATAELASTATATTAPVATATETPALAVLGPNVGVLSTPGSGDGTAPGPRGDYLTLLTSTFVTSAATLGWLWFLTGSIIFFAVAGMFAGLSFRQQERRRYRMVEEYATDPDPFPDDPFAPASTPVDFDQPWSTASADSPTDDHWARYAPPRQSQDNAPTDDAPLDDDFWPASLR
ncbi:MAG: hypothetical protein R2932_24800 [Caldilineaceae bacterium]